ncbi:hypothetical protein NIES4074_10440 [Cylindrospermum sp. NIES-4074]|nr:hypothetical protein NIES4074_10440 [Cylindrospermum sp. NIES-4074]
MKNFKTKLFVLISISLLLNSSVMGQTVIIKNSTQTIMQSEIYEIIGNTTGQIIVKNRATGKVIRTFQMKEEIVRDLFLLERGKIIGASQKKHTVFWNVRTGQVIYQSPQRIYGFSGNETKFFTYNQKKLLVYNYPKMTLACELNGGIAVVPEKFIFSPDDNFLAVLFASGNPESDEYYPGASPSRRSIRYSKLFDINNCQENLEFSKLKIFQLGEFSNNSQFYDIGNYPLYVESQNRYITATWRFVLAKNKLQKL